VAELKKLINAVVNGINGKEIKKKLVIDLRNLNPVASL
jgi:hypothetical protein